MRTAAIVRATSDRARQHANLNQAERATNLDAARAEVDALLVAKGLGPFAVNDKLSRLGDKIMASALAAGGSVAGITAFARALPLPMTAYQRELANRMPAPLSPACGRGDAEVADAQMPRLQTPALRGDGSDDEVPRDTLVTFQAADGTVVEFRRALLADSGLTLLTQMASGDWHDKASAAGHLQLPTVPARQLELLRDYLYEELEPEELSGSELVAARQAARYFGCEALEIIVDDERGRRRLAPFLAPTLAGEFRVKPEFDLPCFLRPFQLAVEEQVLRSPRRNTVDVKWEAQRYCDYTGYFAVFKELELCLLRAGFVDAKATSTIESGKGYVGRVSFTLRPENRTEPPCLSDTEA